MTKDSQKKTSRKTNGQRKPARTATGRRKAPAQKATRGKTANAATKKPARRAASAKLRGKPTPRRASPKTAGRAAPKATDRPSQPAEAINDLNTAPVETRDAELERLQTRPPIANLAHVTPGEIVIPPVVLTPALMEELRRIYADHGLDLGRYTVGGDDDSINPETGRPEFFDSAEDSVSDNDAAWGGFDFADTDDGGFADPSPISGPDIRDVNPDAPYGGGEFGFGYTWGENGFESVHPGDPSFGAAAQGDGVAAQYRDQIDNFAAQQMDYFNSIGNSGAPIDGFGIDGLGIDGDGIGDPGDHGFDAPGFDDLAGVGGPTDIPPGDAGTQTPGGIPAYDPANDPFGLGPSGEQLSAARAAAQAAAQPAGQPTGQATGPASPDAAPSTGAAANQASGSGRSASDDQADASSGPGDTPGGVEHDLGAFASLDTIEAQNFAFATEAMTNVSWFTDAGLAAQGRLTNVGTVAVAEMMDADLVKEWDIDLDPEGVGERGTTPATEEVDFDDLYSALAAPGITNTPEGAHVFSLERDIYDLDLEIARLEKEIAEIKGNLGDLRGPGMTAMPTVRARNRIASMEQEISRLTDKMQSAIREISSPSTDDLKVLSDADLERVIEQTEVDNVTNSTFELLEGFGLLEGPIDHREGASRFEKFLTDVARGDSHSHTLGRAVNDARAKLHSDAKAERDWRQSRRRL